MSTLHPALARLFLLASLALPAFLLVACPAADDDDDDATAVDDDDTAGDDDDTAGDDDDTASDDDDTVGDDDDDTGPDDDDDASDDDDTPTTGNCPLAGSVGVDGTVPCDFGEGGDVYQLLLLEGQTLRVDVDTTSAEQTFDPRLRIVDVLGTWLNSGDDECDCAFPPPGDDYFGCPVSDYTAKFDENVRIHVAAFIEDACVTGVSGGYVLRAEIDDLPITPTLTVDDGPTVFSD